MPVARRIALALLLALGLAGCGHAPDNRTVQQAVDDAAAGG
jgi:hypothetical protein